MFNELIVAYCICNDPKRNKILTILLNLYRVSERLEYTHEAIFH